MLLGVKNSSKHRQIAIKQGLEQSIGLVSPLLFAFRRLKSKLLLGVLFTAKESAIKKQDGFEPKCIKNRKNTAPLS